MPAAIKRSRSPACNRSTMPLDSYRQLRTIPLASVDTWSLPFPSVHIIHFRTYIFQGQFANNNDLQLFFADQLPDAVNSTFTFVSIAGKCSLWFLYFDLPVTYNVGGMNGQDPDDAGNDNLDIEFASGLSHPIPVRYDIKYTPSRFLIMNVAADLFLHCWQPTVQSWYADADWFERVYSHSYPAYNQAVDHAFRPYTTWLDFVLRMENPPLAISTSYVDDEQTGKFILQPLGPV